MTEESERSTRNDREELEQGHKETCFQNMGMRRLPSRTLSRSDAFCISLAFVVALLCFNFGFQYSVLGEGPGTSRKFVNVLPEAPTARKLKHVVDVWEEDDDWEDVELRRIHFDSQSRDSTGDDEAAESEDDDAISENTENQRIGQVDEKTTENKSNSKLVGGENVDLQTKLSNLGLPMSCSDMKKLDYNVVLCNSLTMCASHILLNVAKYANNRLFVEDLKDPLRKSSYPEKDLVRYIDRKPLPSLFHSHTFFCPLSSTDERNITFISMVRNPLERLMSLYYSGTNAFRTVGVKVKSFGECVVSHDKICVGNWTKNTLVRHFCGYDPKCEHASPWAFQRAKSNVAKNYLVVGIVSEFERFLKLLEVLAPTVFSGYDEVTVDMAKLLDKRIFGSALKELSPEVKSQMEKHLELDFKLFNFIHERFFKQMQLCKIG